MTKIVEQCHELDVNVFNREGYLDDSQHGWCWWTRKSDGKEVASIGWRFIPQDGATDALVLFYTVASRHRSNDSRDRKYIVPIEWTPCNFGGERPWFQCPQCTDRVAKLYKTPDNDQFTCRKCGDLIYESQTHRSSIVEANNRLETIREQVQECGLTRDNFHEYYAARQEWIKMLNSYLNELDTWCTEHDLPRMNALPPFEIWVDRLFHRMISEGNRPYGFYGRCTATAKTTGDRCRQPAIGEHGKCYYHGGAPGSGIGEGQANQSAEPIDQLFKDLR